MATGKTAGSAKKSTSSAKKSTSAKSTAKSGAKKSATRTSGTKNTRSAAKSAPQQKPIRREVTAAAFLVAAFFTFLGCFSGEGVFISFIRRFFGGLIGWGYYFVPLAFLTASLVLFFHHGRPVAFRVFCALALPVFIACIYHLFVNLEAFRGPDGKIVLQEDWFHSLWALGEACANGGVVGGGLGILFTYMFSKSGALILFFVFGLLFLWIAVGPFITSLVAAFQARELVPYEPDPEEQPVNLFQLAQEKARKQAQPIPVQTPLQTEEPIYPVISHVHPVETPKQQKLRPISADGIDLKLDEKQSGRKSQKKSGFYDSRSEALSPDEFLEGKTAKPAPMPAPAVEIAPQDEDVAAELLNTAEEIKKPTEISVSEFVAPEGKKKPQKKEEPEGEAFQPPQPETGAPVQEYRFPSIELLSIGEPGSQMDGREEIRLTRERLENTLRSFGINAAINNVVRGPSVTRYEMELEVGVRLNRLTSLSDDIALALGSAGVRIAAIPNRISTVGIEVPNKLVSTVYLRELIDSPAFKNASSKLTFAIGKNIAGEVVVGNIAKLPHLLVAGTTGSGKSVCLNSLILSILYKSTPEEVKFIMVDPKMVEFKVYMGIPHLLVPVVTEAKKASGALQWAVAEMMRRYQTFAENGAREILTYNKLAKSTLDLQPMPQIVIIIDELADLMMVAAKEVEESICRIAQMGRAAGIHLVIATQSPRADIITGLMKANIPSRIAFKVASGLESRIILDAGGSADKLMGNGDMLFSPIGASKPERIQGAWVSDDERENIVDFIKSSGEANYSDDVIRQIDLAAAGKQAEAGAASDDNSGDDPFKDYDELLVQAVNVIFETGQASVSMLQRRLKLGYARAARLVDQMEQLHILGPFEGSKPRQVLITKDEWAEMRYINGTAPAGDPAAMPPLPDDLGEEDPEEE